MSTFQVFVKCLYSPDLYLIYKSDNYRGRYNADKCEKIGGFVLSTAMFVWKLSLYSSPLLAAFFYRRGYMNVEGAITLSRITLWFGLVVCASYCLRSYGRVINPTYQNFLTRFDNIDTSSGVDDIKRYDFNFQDWPVEFHLPIRTYNEPPSSNRSWMSSLLQTPCSIIGYIILHTVGIKLIYPGSISILNAVFSPVLMDGRRVLVIENHGIRYKLKTPEGNTVDSMFIDRRNSSIKSSKKGNFLVVCSEGNAGYYENGIMTTAFDTGFSVLGWNHPGFGCSTGQPYLEEEQSAVNTVMEFAIQRLGFPPEQIILYGWSIGGYSTSWAAAAYPSVRAVVVDASFDDILPLALNQMPGIASSIVKVTIRSHADLNVARLLQMYQGNIKMVRRADDEIIAIIPGDMRTNRGNDLLRKVLKRRYPLVISDEVLSEWLATSGAQQRRLAEEKNVNREQCKRIVDSYIYDHGPTFPLVELGEHLDEDIREQLTIYLASEYMVDYLSTHCVPLPSNVFENLVEDLL